MNLRRITAKEAPPFLASKWLHLDLLIDANEMLDLFSFIRQHASNVFLFSTLGVQPRGQNFLEQEQFLAAWQRYITILQSGNIPQDANFRFFFTAVMTVTTDALRAIDIKDDKEIIMACEPIVQMQLHRFIYSQTDEKFRSMIFGENSISWGVRFSYPQIFQHPLTRMVEDSLEEQRFVNASIFATIRQWIRQCTMPTPFVIEEKRINVPIRIGKECLGWINNHPELIARNIYVQRPS